MWRMPCFKQGARCNKAHLVSVSRQSPKTHLHTSQDKGLWGSQWPKKARDTWTAPQARHAKWEPMDMHFKSSESFCTYFKDLLLHNQVKREQGEKMGQVTVGGGNKKSTYILEETIPLLKLKLYPHSFRHFSVEIWLWELTPRRRKNPCACKKGLVIYDGQWTYGAEKYRDRASVCSGQQWFSKVKVSQFDSFLTRDTNNWTWLSVCELWALHMELVLVPD